MLLYRVLSALVGIPVFLFFIWYGGLPLTALVMLIVVLGILEISRLWDKTGVGIWLPGALVSGALFVFAAGFKMLDLGFVFFISIFMVAAHLIKVYPSFSFKDFSATLLSSVYIGWLLSHLILLRDLTQGFQLLLLVLVATWSTDTFAYFVGINFGRHRLAPELSPKKSVEGALGGLAGSILVSVILGYAIGTMPVLHYLFLGLLIGIVGQVGDLVESAFKRMAGVKDSGNIIPGHGGILDRFDSLFFTAPVVYYYLWIFLLK